LNSFCYVFDSFCTLRRRFTNRLLFNLSSVDAEKLAKKLAVESLFIKHGLLIDPFSSDKSNFYT